MTPSVQTITEEATVTEIAKLFAGYDIGSAIVADESANLLGIVTESDVMEQIAAGDDTRSVPAGEFMSSPVITTESTECIHEAAKLMKQRSVRRLPVVDDGNIVGVLTTTDLVNYMPTLRSAILRERNVATGN